VLCGRGQVRLGDEWHDLESGSVVFVPPGVRHQYRNRGKTDFCFLCGVPIPRLRKTLGKETQ
jgi:mannose-6-phosphate isomerase-like protein (cupin superfamily)